jgi:hypothetical protein
MLTNYQKMLLQDLTSPTSYGSPLVGWKGQTEIYRNPSRPVSPPGMGPLSPDLARTFVEETYVALKTTRTVTLYRGYETKGLQAPFGMDHPSFYQSLVSQRHPGTPDGRWWSPGRPSKSVDNLGLSDMHRAEDRDNPAVLKEWNRLDYYLEADLPSGSLVYVGRAAPQQESALYGGNKYGGGGFQFRLTDGPDRVFRSMKRHVAT